MDPRLLLGFSGEEGSTIPLLMVGMVMFLVLVGIGAGIFFTVRSSRSKKSRNNVTEDEICVSNPSWCSSFSREGDETSYMMKKSTIQIVPDPHYPFKPGPQTNWRECVNENGTLKPGCKAIDLTSDDDMRVFLNDLRTAMMSYDRDFISNTPMGEFLSSRYGVQSLDPLVVYDKLSEAKGTTITTEVQDGTDNVPLWLGVLKVMYERYIAGEPVPEIDDEEKFGLSGTGRINLAPFFMFFAPSPSTGR